MVAMCFARSRRKEKIFVENVSNIIAVKFGFNRTLMTIIILYLIVFVFFLSGRFEATM
jgi:phage shock protein PspC (stress-responsive transcriptional regulator)